MERSIRLDAIEKLFSPIVKFLQGHGVNPIIIPLGIYLLAIGLWIYRIRVKKIRPSVYDIIRFVIITAGVIILAIFVAPNGDKLQ